MDNKIRLITYERQTATLIDPDRFEFNPRGRLLWLQRLIFQVLRWLRANSLQTSVSYETVEIDTSNILNALMENQRDVEMLYNRRARYVVMGPRDLARLCDQPEIRELMRFNFTSLIGINSRRTVLGLEVVVVPWVEGFFVLPDLEQERVVAHAATK